MRTIKTWFATIAVLLCSISVHAHDFEVDRIYYNIFSIENLTAEVTYKVVISKVQFIVELWIFLNA